MEVTKDTHVLKCPHCREDLIYKHEDLPFGFENDSLQDYCPYCDTLLTITPVYEFKGFLVEE